MLSIIISCIGKMTGIKSDIFPRLITPRKYYGGYMYKWKALFLEKCFAGENFAVSYFLVKIN